MNGGRLAISFLGPRPVETTVRADGERTRPCCAPCSVDSARVRDALQCGWGRGLARAPPPRPGPPRGSRDGAPSPQPAGASEELLCAGDEGLASACVVRTTIQVTSLPSRVCCLHTANQTAAAMHSSSKGPSCAIGRAGPDPPSRLHVPVQSSLSDREPQRPVRRQRSGEEGRKDTWARQQPQHEPAAPLVACHRYWRISQ